MKRLFGTISTVAAVLLISRHTAEIVSNHYWWFAAILLLGIAGQTICSMIKKENN